MELDKDFSKYLGRVRDLHREAQTARGLKSVVDKIGTLDIPVDKRVGAIYNSYNDRLLEAIANKVIPDRFEWRMGYYVGGGAEIILIGVDKHD